MRMPKRISDETLLEYCRRRQRDLVNDLDRYEIQSLSVEENCKLEAQLNYDITKARLNELNNIIAICEKRKRY